MERVVILTRSAYGAVSLPEPVLRFPDNPILSARDVNGVWRDPALQVVTVHNAGVGTVGGQTVVLFRSHLRSGLSVLGTARSADGVTGWRVDPTPALLPATPDDCFAAGLEVDEAVEMEAGGVEDPRVHVIDGTFAVTYSAYHARQRNRVRVALATSSDLRRFVRHGPLLDRDMRNVVLFPDRIDGRHVGLFRPNDVLEGDIGGAYTRIHVGTSPDLRTGPWAIDPDPVMATGHGPSAFSDKIGPGAPPIRTRHGWLNLFHGVRATMDGNPYVLGVALHDLADPRRVRMSSIPVLFPTKADCRVAEDAYVHVPNVVFTCGATRRDDGTIVIYYAGNDTVLNVAASHEDVLAELCVRYGQDPVTGGLLYPLQDPPREVPPRSA